MQINKHYLNCKLANVPYLLPYGQTIVDHVPGLQLNETGSSLWNALLKNADRDALLCLLGADSNTSEEELAALQQDLDDYLSGLAAQHALLPDAPVSTYSAHSLKIGPLLLSVKAPDALIERYFHDFIYSTSAAYVEIELYRQPPEFRQNGTVLLRSSELILMETEDTYLFLPLNHSAVKEMHVRKDGSHAGLYCPLYADTDTCMEDVFHAMRFAFLIAAAEHGLYVVHSASLLYQDRAWLFSASSGTGKSTHTQLWKDQFDTPLLNGDLNMIGMENKTAMCYGLPWNGTSGIATPGKWKLGGITFLKQSPQDQVIPLSEDRKILSLSQRLISPAWTAAQLTRNLDFCRQIVSCTPIFSLHCTKEPHAAQVMKDAIDQLP